MSRPFFPNLFDYFAGKVVWLAMVELRCVRAEKPYIEGIRLLMNGNRVQDTQRYPHCVGTLVHWGCPLSIAEKSGRFQPVRQAVEPISPTDVITLFVSAGIHLTEKSYTAVPARIGVGSIPAETTVLQTGEGGSTPTPTLQSSE